ncbi:MAG: heavy-metal-associated domain-containing protein [Pseudomonadota bacterium]|nr:MAG: heavy-metal-associated domain-containing protein [Pseudomonadota bacterium]
MGTLEIKVQNTKCQGCARTITDALAGIDGISTVEVDVATGRITVAGEQPSHRAIVRKLAELGYPE